MTDPVPPAPPGLVGGPARLDCNTATPVDPRVAAEADLPAVRGRS